MYSKRTGLVFGFHGCDQSLVENIITGKTSLKPSINTYDWLGHGVYFWDNSPSRALDFALHLKNNPRLSNSPVKKPAVIGAILNLGYCLDLLDFENLQFLKNAYNTFSATYNLSDWKLPQNKAVGSSHDLLLRELDCSVLETVHEIREGFDLEPFDSVRGVFWEGKELYPNAGFREKDHIQICVRNPNCIKGYFLPREPDIRHKAI
jgi:hypothetical protein